MLEETPKIICQDKVFKYKNRYVVYAVHARPETKKYVLYSVALIPPLEPVE